MAFRGARLLFTVVTIGQNKTKEKERPKQFVAVEKERSKIGEKITEPLCIQKPGKVELAKTSGVNPRQP